MVTQVPDRLEPPPRLPGISPEADIGAMREWMWQLYENLILNKGVIQAVDQPQGSFDPTTGIVAQLPIGIVIQTRRSENPATYLGYGTWERIATGRTIVGVDEDDPDFATAGAEFGEKEVTLTAAEMPSHTHTQDAHNHTQNAHNHTQDAHNHTQDAHTHGQSVVNSANDGTTGVRGSSDANTDTDGDTASVVATNQATVATNQAATATNIATTATNQNAGGDGAHNNVQPSIAFYIWERTA